MKEMGSQRLKAIIREQRGKLEAIQYHCQIFPLIEFKEPMDENMFRDWWKKMLELVNLVSGKDR
jgi:hypothetical protein